MGRTARALPSQLMVVFSSSLEFAHERARRAAADIAPSVGLAERQAVFHAARVVGLAFGPECRFGHGLPRKPLKAVPLARRPEPDFEREQFPERRLLFRALD